MARLIWTEPALSDLDTVAEYISLDNPDAARRLVERILDEAERSERFPDSGKRVRESSGSRYRELVIAPCRIFYRAEKSEVFVLFVMRGEQLFRKFLLQERNRKKKSSQL